MNKGFKFITWIYGDNRNADMYMKKITNGESIHFTELAENRGYLDTQSVPGIYFCETLDDLFVWLEEAFEWDTRIEAVEILEVSPKSVVTKRVYEGQVNRVAYVTDEIAARALHNRELPKKYLELFKKHFD